MSESWIVCQIGAREHYAVARSLHRRGALDRLLTDAWIRPNHPLGHVKQGLKERFHPELASTSVWAPNLKCITFEASMRFRRIAGWNRVMARNDWFQRLAVQELSRVGARAKSTALFAYSYAALDIFKLSRARGWRTVLGQIDAGPADEKIVSRLYDASAHQNEHWIPVPSDYWKRWREECELADEIVVNSAWSKSGLEEEGIDGSKIRVVPLAYERSKASAGHKKEYSSNFTTGRPLRVLFLGQISLRKGVGPLLEASELLREKKVEFWFVGPIQITVPPKFLHAPNIKWFGPVARSETDRFYSEADVFIFPTYCDGFGLTQLEAQAWHLPIIASQFCGEVVKDDVNGILLAEISSKAIANALCSLLTAPQRLEAMATRTSTERRLTLEDIGVCLVDHRQEMSSRQVDPSLLAT